VDRLQVFELLHSRLCLPLSRSVRVPNRIF
jgi:hypothetical protein